MTAIKKTKKEVSIRAYAATIGVDEKTVRTARDHGLLGKGYIKKTGKIISDVADKVWGNEYKVIKSRPGVNKLIVIERLEEKEKQDALLPPAVNNTPLTDSEDDILFDENISVDELLLELKITPDMTAQEAMRVNSVIDAAVNKKKLEELEGILVNKAAVEKSLFLLGSELKKALLDVPARCVRDIMAATTEVEGIKIITDELILVLSTYGNMKTNTIK